MRAIGEDRRVCKKNRARLRNLGLARRCGAGQLARALRRESNAARQSAPRATRSARRPTLGRGP
eukprot:scaffold44979_cov31-Tisochrysis_lutea.AAC.2